MVLAQNEPLTLKTPGRVTRLHLRKVCGAFFESGGGSEPSGRGIGQIVVREGIPAGFGRQAAFERKI